MTEDTQAAFAKEEALKKLLANYGGLAVAYSGGVDSTYLADVAHEVLGDRLRLLLADSPSMPRSEFDEAITIARDRGWRLDVIHTREFEKEEFLQNNRNRCYICKGELFDRMRAYAAEHAIPVIAYGETADDTADATRVGKIAADEKGVLAPLLDAGLKKDEIRLLSRRRNLPTWNKASFACLASRFPTGRPLTIEEIARVERAEETLKRHGFRQYRARHHGDLCRIEIDPQDFTRLLAPEVSAVIVAELKKAGYRYVTLDLAGYRTGSSAL